MSTPLPPVIFVNPNVFAPSYHVGLVRDDRAVVGLVSGALRDQPIEALGWLADRIGGQIVGTAAPIAGTDARDMLLSRGLRAPWAPGWFEGSTLAERFSGIAAWLSKHGPRAAIVIDEPPLPNALAPSAPSGSIVMTVPSGVQLTREACAGAAEIVSRRAGAGKPRS